MLKIFLRKFFNLFFFFKFIIFSSVLEINLNFSLKGESILWLILRTEDKLDENSAIIKISKEDKVFMKLNVRGNLDKIYFILNSWDER